MAKRKTGVNDIIYELDNDDIEISSEDEARGNKIKRFETESNSELSISQTIIDLNNEDVLISSSMDESYNTESESNSQIGGKNSPEIMIIENVKNIINDDELDCVIEPSIDAHSKTTIDGPETIILNEDITIDSPASNNELGVIGCENKTPLITIHFKTNKLANLYKEKIKNFIINLLNLNNVEDIVDPERGNNLDLEIWPEDLTDSKPKTPEVDQTDSLFFVDTDPNVNENNDIPKYTQGSTVISNLVEKNSEPVLNLRKGPICFNCDGDHYLRDCQLPRNNIRIAEKRKLIPSKHGRYHVEDEQKYGHLIPGRISSQLRHALGLKRHELPLHIYRMRMLGYPPGWLEEARISHSGISMFDSAGNAILEADDQEEQRYEVGSKDKFDIKKILDFPGFNVPASSRYKEEANILGMPPMSEQDSKLLMLQTLAPNAMKAYKRKKLSLFPSGNPNDSQESCQAEMELDSGDEVAEFPLVPPLPDEAPPPPPPPPPPPELLPQSPSSDGLMADKELSSQDKKCSEEQKENISNDVELISVMKVSDIPVPEEDLIVIDEDFENISCIESGKVSPTLDDLEEKKKRLLKALEKGSPLKEHTNDSIVDTDDNDKQFEHIGEDNNLGQVDESINTVASTSNITSSPIREQVSTDTVVSETPSSDIDISKVKTGSVKTSSYGTPVLNIASPYVKLPSDDKFAKDICDVINFENLPNSTGKYKKICNLLKKVKSEVDRIQES
ncbi:zinc finger CCHC domain-containing protein 8 homolog [Battus philenor]|uniref:zinc finger CCHC domain-containing protein 8 homolog n=1 Tax=Battus philenor TaxID=42288 RepID=UPI0035D12663